MKSDYVGMGFSEIGSSVYMDEDDKVEHEFNKALKNLAASYDSGNILLQDQKLGQDKQTNRVRFGDI